jgi:uncharacterized membrane protein
MVDSLYSFLASVGFTHPLHPMLTHLPMGLIIAMVVFSLLAVVWQKPAFSQTAFHCSVLALLGVVPVIITGALDWLQFQGGEWNIFIIIKMVLAGVLTLLLAIAVAQKNRGAGEGRMLLLYLLCLACAGGLGYSGGELVYG